MPMTTAETAFALAMQSAGEQRDIEQRLMLIERALLSLAVERQRAGETLPEALDKIVFELARRGLRA